jgi:hypothetical protein
MQTKSPTNPRFTIPETNETLLPKVTILYDAMPAGKRAMNMLNTVAGKPDATAALRPQLWRLGLLEDPDWFATALAEAADTDLLVVAIDSTERLGTSLKNWIELFLARRRKDKIAMVGLIAPSNQQNEPASERLQFFRNAARKAEIEFFSPKWPEPSLPLYSQESCFFPAQRGFAMEVCYSHPASKAVNRAISGSFCTIS